MAVRERYFMGGFDPAKPNNNVAESWDDETNAYTAWDESGAVSEQRPLTDDERSAVVVPVTVTANERIVAAVSALAALDDISAPVLPTDVLDILTDVRTALEG